MSLIEEIKEDIFRSSMRTLVCPVNTQGVMGKGLALSFKHRFPGLFESYREACDRRLLKIDLCFLWHGTDHDVLCFPTKDQWRFKSNSDWIYWGLDNLKYSYRDMGISSIAFPPLGCGEGGLHYPSQVRPFLLDFAHEVDIPVTLYSP